MGRPDKQARQQKRARVMVRAALGRGRAGEAADALLQLPSAERDFALREIAATMQRELARAHEQRDNATVLAWLSRSEREPRLLELLEQPSSQARFALLTAALRGRQWPRAEPLLAGLRSVLAPPELVTVLEQLVRSRGEPPAGVIGLLATLDDEASRLGYEVSRSRVQHAAPADLDAARTLCLYCFGSEPWPRFEEVQTGWLHDVPKPVATSLRVLAAQLSERELLLRSRDGGAAVLAPARFIASAALEAGAPPELQAAVANALRATARALVIGTPNAKALDSLAVVASAAQRYAALAPLVAACALGTSLEAASPTARTELLRLSLLADPSPSTLVSAAIELHLGAGNDAGPQPRTPEWMLQAVEVAIEAPAQLARALQRAREGAAGERARKNHCAEPVHALLELLPAELAVTTIDRLWDHASEALRIRLATESGDVLLRLRERATPGKQSLDVLAALVAEMQPDLPPPSKHELRALMRTSLGQQIMQDLADEGGGLGPLPASREPAFWRLAKRAAPYDVNVLDLALELDRSGTAARPLLREHLARHTTLSARLHGLREAVLAGCDAVAEAFERHFCDGLTPSAPEAAEVLLSFKRTRAPRRLRNEVARALLLAVERDPEQAKAPVVARALALAQRRVKPRKPKAEKAPRKAGTGKKTAQSLEQRAAAAATDDQQLALDIILQEPHRG